MISGRHQADPTHTGVSKQSSSQYYDSDHDEEDPKHLQDTELLCSISAIRCKLASAAQKSSRKSQIRTNQNSPLRSPQRSGHEQWPSCRPRPATRSRPSGGGGGMCATLFDCDPSVSLGLALDTITIDPSKGPPSSLFTAEVTLTVMYLRRTL